MLYEVIPGMFNSYNIPEREKLVAYTFSDLQLAMIHNEITNIATAKISLKLDLAKPAEYAQAEAYMRGQLDMLQYLLDCHNTSKDN